VTKRETLILFLEIIEDAYAKGKQATYPDSYDRPVFDTLYLIERQLNSELDRTYEGDEE